MPVPYNLTMQVNEEHRPKITTIGQILILFNPSIQLQQNTNPLDGTSVFGGLTTYNEYGSVPADVDRTIDHFNFDIYFAYWVKSSSKS